MVTGHYFNPFGVFLPTATSSPGESFKKIFCCGNLIPHGKSSATVAHAVAAAFMTGMDVVIPNFQHDLIHWKAEKKCLKFTMSLNIRNNSQISAFPAIV